jgi:membrane protein YdbS with pleckstrin-like domain
VGDVVGVPVWEWRYGIDALRQAGPALSSGTGTFFPAASGTLRPFDHQGMSMSNENQAVYDSHPAMFRNHPLGYLLTWVLIIAPVVLLLLFRKPIAEMGNFPPAMLLAATGLGMLILMYWFLKTRAIRLRIDGDQVHLEEGLLSKHHVELHVGQIRAVRVFQGFLDRVFRVGRIEIFTTGDAPEFVVGGMPDPHRVRDHVRNHRESVE